MTQTGLLQLPAAELVRILVMLDKWTWAEPCRQTTSAGWAAGWVAGWAAAAAAAAGGSAAAGEIYIEAVGFTGAWADATEAVLRRPTCTTTARVARLLVMAMTNRMHILHMPLVLLKSDYVVLLRLLACGYRRVHADWMCAVEVTSQAHSSQPQKGLRPL